MSEKITCFYCKGGMESGFTTHVAELEKCIVIIKAIPHNYCRAITQSDFSSDCTKATQAGCRPSRSFCARWRKICK